eukprot:4639683-Pleurochrysis_carterae.AAC.2
MANIFSKEDCEPSSLVDAQTAQRTGCSPSWDGLGTFENRLVSVTCCPCHSCATLSMQNGFTRHTKAVSSAMVVLWQAEHHTFGCIETYVFFAWSIVGPLTRQRTKIREKELTETGTAIRAILEMQLATQYIFQSTKNVARHRIDSY